MTHSHSEEPPSSTQQHPEPPRSSCRGRPPTVGAAHLAQDVPRQQQLRPPHPPSPSLDCPPNPRENGKEQGLPTTGRGGRSPTKPVLAARPHTRAHAHVLTHTSAHQTCSHTHMCTPPRVLTPTCKLTHTHKNTLIHAHTAHDAHTPTCTHIHTSAHMACLHAHVHTGTHHTRAHTHTPSLPPRGLRHPAARPAWAVQTCARLAASKRRPPAEAP